MKSADEEIGQRIRERRIMCGMSQRQLGDALGVTFQQVQKYERGKSRVSISCGLRIAEILEVPLTELLPEATREMAGIAMQNRQALEIVRGLSQLPERHCAALAKYVKAVGGHYGI